VHLVGFIIKKWVVEICGRMPRIEVADDICLRRPRPIQGCRAMMMMMMMMMMRTGGGEYAISMPLI
jgi:hypothetical protein